MARILVVDDDGTAQGKTLTAFAHMAAGPVELDAEAEVGAVRAGRDLEALVTVRLCAERNGHQQHHEDASHGPSLP